MPGTLHSKMRLQGLCGLRSLTACFLQKNII